MKQRTAELWRDAHVYGGTALSAAGAYMQFGPGAGMLLLGAVLWYMGVFRMRRTK